MLRQDVCSSASEACKEQTALPLAINPSNVCSAWTASSGPFKVWTTSQFGSSTWRKTRMHRRGLDKILSLSLNPKLCHDAMYTR